MTAKTNKFADGDALDHKAHAAATRVAERHGLRDRARTTFFQMADELLEELQPAIEANVRDAADTAAKTRLRDVLALPEAKGRRDLAEKLALETNSTPAQIAEMLRASPEAAQHDPLAKLMAGQTPGISSDEGGDFEEFAEGEETERAANYILNAGAGS